MLHFLNDYVEQKNISAKIEMVGCRCQGLCADGLSIFTNDKDISE